ncbi:hypothetical protein NEIG_01309 [Nematocida sp. ERTm5]|nr:hypothetical protein NEIRO02_0984 [Nematocida sp. AWRm79]KAI5183369.1 hypothetical protein NEIRO03_0966 [Nematocida sp. AWRm78]OAG32071.1 hypothetical protein NEIG_01309 [Nematocida sp. ERTm5]
MKATRTLSFQRIFLLFSTVLLVGLLLNTLCNIFWLAIILGALFSVSILVLSVYRALNVPSVCNKEYNEYLENGKAQLKELLKK